MLSFAAMLNARELIYILLFSSLHETGHLLALILVKGYPDILRFSFYGFALKYSCPLSKHKELAVLLSGPLINLILYLLIGDAGNFILFFLNILPAYPLDGGRIVYLYSQKAAKILSLVTLAVVFALSLYLIIMYRSFTLFLICIYLFAFYINN